MRKKLHAKLGSRTGETISETMIALLVIVLALTMLAGGIVSAAKVNQKTKNMHTEFVAATDAPVEKTVAINGQSVTVNVYTTTGNNYVYYSAK